MVTTAYYLSPEGNLQKELSNDDIIRAFKSRQGLLWVDIAEITEEDGRFLEDKLHFHRLAVEDCRSHLLHSPKIDDFGEYLFIIIHGINHTAESDIVETTELAIFLGPHFVISHHNMPLYSVEAVRKLVAEDGRFMQRGADFLAHSLIDALIDNVIPTIDKMSDVAEEIEEEVIRSPQQVTLEAVLKLKRSTLRVHRVMVPQREVLNRLSRGEFKIISREAEIFYRDIYDHLVRVQDLNQTIRDRADYALSTYLSSVANRQNETMRVLSIVATIFLPLTLLAGIYGMNFAYMPELGWRWGYFAVLAFIGAVIIVALWLFSAKRWIGWGRRQARRARLFTVEPEKLVGHLGRVLKRPHKKPDITIDG